jgi:hypothetical protein
LNQSTKTRIIGLVDPVSCNMQTTLNDIDFSIYLSIFNLLIDLHALVSII